MAQEWMILKQGDVQNCGIFTQRDSCILSPLAVNTCDVVVKNKDGNGLDCMVLVSAGNFEIYFSPGF
jgi:hypothetical protein